MISANKSPESDNALMRRIQRYAQTSTIFRTTDSSGDMRSVQRTASAPAKATLLPGPSSLPVGRTSDSQNFGQNSGSLSMMPDSFPTELPVTPKLAIDSSAAAIEHVTQMQRSSTSQTFNNPPTVPMPQMQASPVAESISETTNMVQAAPPSETAVIDGDWNRLQRIIKGHEAKSEPVSDSQPAPVTSPTVQRTEAAPPTMSADSIQRAIDTAESSQHPVAPKKAPLESIWPVQQIESEATVTSDEPVVMRQPDSPISTEPVQTAAEEQTIRKKLNDVSVTQRSDSSVELHLPRRPRPAVIQAKPAKEDANKSFWDRMRKIEGKEPDAVQRTVQTEIGPLPADMWEILGETPPGAVASGGDSTPDVQTKSADMADSIAPSTTPDREQTETPSFLAEAATTAQPAPDVVQRAIAAAEAPEINIEAAKVTELAVDPTPSVQRKETSPATEPVPSKRELSATTTSIEAAPTPSSLADESPVQRSIVASAESESASEQIGEAPPTTQNMRETATSAIPTSTESGSNLADQVQRAIHAAEAPVSSPQAAQTPPSAASVPSATPIASTDKPLQAKRSDSAGRTSTTAPFSTTVPESNAPDFPAVDAIASSEAVQRSATSTESESSSFMPHAVDLNAETGPLPALPAQSPDTSNAIQRAIAAAEAPSPANEPPPLKSERPLTAPPIIQMKRASSPELNAPSSKLETPASTGTETAVPSSSSSTPETIQRAIAAAETAPEPTKATTSSSETTRNADTTAPAETPTESPVEINSSQDTIQRAISAAEAPASTPSARTETAVPTPDASPAVTETPTSETIQRAISAAETPTSTPPARTETAVPTPDASPVVSETPISETVQRAIAAAEAPTSTPADIHNSQFSTPKPAQETAVPTPETIQRAVSKTPTPGTVQRAIAAAEMPSSMKTTTPVIQRSPTVAQTVVTTPNSLTQNRRTQQETAVASPTVSTPQTSTTSLMRAIAAAETTTTTTEPSPSTYQWPDIIAPSSSQTQDNIQRSENSIENNDYQIEMEPESAENKEHENAANIDVDQLANAVYNQLRRRLAIEWERGRGKR